MDEYDVDTCVCDYRIYQDVWRPVIGEELPCESNDKSYHAAAFFKLTVGIVGHVPCTCQDFAQCLERW